MKSNEIITKEYIVIDKIGNKHFIAKKLNSEEFITDRDYLEQNLKFEIDRIHIKDTLEIKTQKGIFGIEFF